MLAWQAKPLRQEQLALPSVSGSRNQHAFEKTSVHWDKLPDKQTLDNQTHNCLCAVHALSLFNLVGDKGPICNYVHITPNVGGKHPTLPPILEAWHLCAIESSQQQAGFPKMMAEGMATCMAYKFC